LIFITVGTQKFQFNRLFKEIDSLIERGIINEEVYAQLGYSTYNPKYFKGTKLLNEDSMIKYIEESRVVITHAGTSSIIKSLKMNKKVIVIPREIKYGEHVDNHQLEITNSFEARNLIEPVYEISSLEEKLQQIHMKEFTSYEFDNSKILNSIRKDIELLGRVNN
jgi:UDP-N-acetylglucosamine transferase subunit ALG13